MLAQLLAHFPLGAHALTVVGDPDHLLDAEEVGAALAERGFRVIREADPVALRVRIEQARPWSAERPVIVVGESSDRLPYDCWHGASNCVTLQLGEFFPGLAVAELRALTPDQLQRLARIPLPEAQLTSARTRAFLLERLFDATPDNLRVPAHFVVWLSALHRSWDAPSSALQNEILGWLLPLPAFRNWDLPSLLSSPESFDHFLQTQWATYLNSTTGLFDRTGAAALLLDFSNDGSLQDGLTKLIRDGTIQPQPVADPMSLPGWARAGAVAVSTQRQIERARELIGTLAEALTNETESGAFRAWAKIASTLARLDLLSDVIEEDADLASRLKDLAAYAENRFSEWLPLRYRSLAGLGLPEPHHVHHIPGYLAHRRRQRTTGRVALLVLDGISMTDWHAIAGRWRTKRPAWHTTEHALLAQIPTITSISRQALFSGLRPADFASSITTSDRDAASWKALWEREGLSAERARFTRLSSGEGIVTPQTGPAAYAILDTSIDDLVHGAKMGDVQFHVDREVWLDGHAPRIESAVEELLTLGFGIWITSDHGHVEARGIGQPGDGSVPDIRAKRARLYTDRALAEAAAKSSPGAILWGDDGVLPSDRWAVVPPVGKAFAPEGSTVVTHGGTSIAEVIVPFVAIDVDRT